MSFAHIMTIASARSDLSPAEMVFLLATGDVNKVMLGRVCSLSFFRPSHDARWVISPLVPSRDFHLRSAGQFTHLTKFVNFSSTLILTKCGHTELIPFTRSYATLLLFSPHSFCTSAFSIFTFSTTWIRTRKCVTMRTKSERTKYKAQGRWEKG